MPTQQLPMFPGDTRPGLSRHSTIAEAVGPFLEYLRHEGRSVYTISAFRSDLGLVVEFFGPEMVLNDFTTSNLNRFMMWIEQGRGIPCSRKSYARRVTTLKAFFKYLKAENILPDDPAEAILQRSGAAPLQTILSEDEIGRLLAVTLALRTAEKPDARPELLLRLLLDTGIKKGECMKLTPADVIRTDPDAPMLVVRHPSPDNVYRERKISLDPDWLTVLDEYLSQYAPPNTLFDCTARNLEYILTDVAKAAGVEGQVSFEILRWTCAVRDYRRGADLEQLREKMGLSRVSWRETSDKIKRLSALKDQQRL